MVAIPGLPDPLPGVLVPRHKTCAGNAWLGGLFHTIRLIEPLPALRVHVRGGAAAAVDSRLAFGAGTSGRWFAIGDVVMTRSAYTAAHALPARFTHHDDWVLPANTLLNVGLAGPLFGHPGGALQAERLSGPAPRRHAIKGFWGNRLGHA